MTGAANPHQIRPADSAMQRNQKKRKMNYQNLIQFGTETCPPQVVKPYRYQKPFAKVRAVTEYCVDPKVLFQTSTTPGLVVDVTWPSDSGAANCAAPAGFPIPAASLCPMIAMMGIVSSQLMMTKS